MTEHTIRPRRSFIFSPGLRPEMYPKALACGADIVCVELGDGIAPKDKAAARANAMALFAEPQADDGVERIVRINCVREAFGLADVQAVLASRTPPPALMLPKVRTPDEVVWLDDLLSERGHATRLHVIIETNPGLEAAWEIAHCSDRLDALFFGGVDMAGRATLRQRLGAAALRPFAGRACRGFGGSRRHRRPLSGPGRPAGHGDRGETGPRPGVLREGRDPSQADSGP